MDALEAALDAFAARRTAGLLLEADCALGDRARLLAALPNDEQARAKRFRRPQDQLAHAAGRVLTRLVAGRCAGAPMAAVEIALGEQGKPETPGGPAFNLSHSGGRVLAGFSWRGDIGVDIEAERELADLAGLAARVLSAREREDLDAGPETSRTRRFLQAWTRKEALAKATGVGLRVEPREIAAEPGGQVAMSGRLWLCTDLPADDGFVAALACEPAFGAPPPILRLSTGGLCSLAGLSDRS